MTITHKKELFASYANCPYSKSHIQFPMASGADVLIVTKSILVCSHKIWMVYPVPSVFKIGAFSYIKPITHEGNYVAIIIPIICR